MDLKALHRGEVIAVVGGLLLGISVFLPWYTLGNMFAHVGSCHNDIHHLNTSCSAWDALSVFPILFLLGAAAPLILGWIVVRGYALAWPRGELTAVVAVIAIVLTLFLGVIDKPGEPPAEIGVAWGWFIALLGGLLMVTGSAWRARESAPRRNPPGVL
jgi:O-antigen/teichoic acid export membrane protein